MEMQLKNLSGKRLLVLGSTGLIAEIVAKAQSMGAVVGVVDYNPYDKSPGKQVADEHYDISLADTDAVALLVREGCFDGVLTGFSDSYLGFYLEICRKAGVVCYGGARQFEIATDKVAFKKACIESGVPAIPGGSTRSVDEAVQLANRLGYPVILKPADGSGSRGVIRCDGNSGLRDAFDYANSFSAKKTVIVEKYLTCENMAASYYIVDGRAAMSSCCDRYVYVSQVTGSSVTSMLSFPSRHYARYCEEVDAKVRAMLAENGFANGMLSLQAFVDDDGFYLCEMCYRPSGGHNFVVIEDQTGVDELGMLIEFALTGSSSESNLAIENPAFPDRCFALNVIAASGATIGSFEGHERVVAHPSVIWAIQRAKPGDVVGVDGTVGQIVESIWLRCEEGRDPGGLIDEIVASLEVTDESGASIIAALPTPFFE